MTIRNFLEYKPQVHDTAYVDPQACVIGNVLIGKNSSVWPMVVARGDVNKITIGNNSNIQDGSILHVTHKSEEGSEIQSKGAELIIGDSVTVGHAVILHGCKVEDYCLIGMGATVMDNCVIENHSILAAGSILTEGKRIKSGELWVGSPARKVRDLSQKQKQRLEYSAEHYVKLMKKYKEYK